MFKKNLSFFFFLVWLTLLTSGCVVPDQSAKHGAEALGSRFHWLQQRGRNDKVNERI
jgi:hypothetical protein